MKKIYVVTLFCCLLFSGFAKAVPGAEGAGGGEGNLFNLVDGSRDIAIASIRDLRNGYHPLELDQSEFEWAASHLIELVKAISSTTVIPIHGGETPCLSLNEKLALEVNSDRCDGTMPDRYAMADSIVILYVRNMMSR